jgi:hypothetical protein
LNLFKIILDSKNKQNYIKDILLRLRQKNTTTNEDTITAMNPIKTMTIIAILVELLLLSEVRISSGTEGHPRN